MYEYSERMDTVNNSVKDVSNLIWAIAFELKRLIYSHKDKWVVCVNAHFDYNMNTIRQWHHNKLKCHAKHYNYIDCTNISITSDGSQFGSVTYMIWLLFFFVSVTASRKVYQSCVLWFLVVDLFWPIANYFCVNRFQRIQKTHPGNAFTTQIHVSCPERQDTTYEHGIPIIRTREILQTFRG